MSYGTEVKINYFCTGFQVVVFSTFSEPNQNLAIDELDSLLKNVKSCTVASRTYRCLPDTLTHKPPRDAEALWIKANDKHSYSQDEIYKYSINNMPPINMWQQQVFGDKEESTSLVKNYKKILTSKLGKMLSFAEYNF
jgi:hypothetical protein